MTAPYTDNDKESDTFIRKFECDVDDGELVWHQDARTRRVTVLEGIGWKLQLDNQLPVELLPDCSYIIPKELHHRLLKGSGELIIEIKEKLHNEQSK